MPSMMPSSSAASRSVMREGVVGSAMGEARIVGHRAWGAASRPVSRRVGASASSGCTIKGHVRGDIRARRLLNQQLSGFLGWHGACSLYDVPAARRPRTRPRKPAMSLEHVEKLIKDHKVEFVDLRFCDMRGVQHHVTFPKSIVDASLFEDGKMFDGSSIARLEGHQRVGHGAAAGRQHRVPRSVHRRSDARADLRHPRPGDDAGLRPRSARRRQARRGLPQVQRHRRPGLLRPGTGILHLRQRPLRERHGPHLLPHRFGRSALELGPRIRRRQHRLPPDGEGWLLPRRAARLAARPARRDVQDAGSRSASKSKCTTTKSRTRASARSAPSSTRW